MPTLTEIIAAQDRINRASTRTVKVTGQQRGTEPLRVEFIQRLRHKAADKIEITPEGTVIYRYRETRSPYEGE
jgi:hypothetical protein